MYQHREEKFLEELGNRENSVQAGEDIYKLLRDDKNDSFTFAVLNKLFHNYSHKTIKTALQTLVDTERITLKKSTQEGEVDQYSYFQ